MSYFMGICVLFPRSHPLTARQHNRATCREARIESQGHRSKSSVKGQYKIYVLHEYILRGVLRVLINGRISRFPLRRSIGLRSILTHDAWEASSAEDEKVALTAASSGDLSDATTVTGQSASVHENSQSPKDSCATTKDCVETELRARATPSCCCRRRRIRQGVYERFAVRRRSQRAELSLVTSR